mmetsp:Transcript_132062/g.329400  ORF Transcript_132062/g.329400 Transcript_132062/m.329400 type:complete len:205 (+) Transcript_132062:1206-1820(+)
MTLPEDLKVLNILKASSPVLQPQPCKGTWHAVAALRELKVSPWVHQHAITVAVHPSGLPLLWVIRNVNAAKCLSSAEDVDTTLACLVIGVIGGHPIEVPGYSFLVHGPWYAPGSRGLLLDAEASSGWPAPIVHPQLRASLAARVRQRGLPMHGGSEAQSGASNVERGHELHGPRHRQRGHAPQAAPLGPPGPHLCLAIVVGLID